MPDLLLPEAEDPHVGSIDVDLALDAAKLNDGRYVELLGELLNTGRYRLGAKPFQLLADVDLGDGGPRILVEVEFLAPREVRFKKNKPRLLKGFRVLQADACGTAFRAPVGIELEGWTLLGARNTVRFRVASLADFLVMKAHALAGRDKPKDAYDICYCLDYFPGGLEALAAAWGERGDEPAVRRAIEILQDKFESPEHYGPAQVVEFFSSPDPDARAMEARRAYELVRSLLKLLPAGI